MFSQENVIKILQLSSQFYQADSLEEQKRLADQVFILTSLPDVPVDHDEPPKMKKIDSVPVWERSDKRFHHGSTHPPISKLINEAILELHGRNGSSLQAIKKFIAQSYHLDVCKLGRYIRKYLREAVENGILLHPKGKGATGHFKLTQRAKRMVSKETIPKNLDKKKSRLKLAGRKMGKTRRATALQNKNENSKNRIKVITKAKTGSAKSAVKKSRSK